MSINKLTIFLVLGFLLYAIVKDPQASGVLANQFAGFIGGVLSALGQFFAGFFNGADSGTATTTTVTLPGHEPADMVNSLSGQHTESHYHSSN